MNLVAVDNYNIILTEGSRDLLNDAYELDSIGGNNYFFEKHSIPFFKNQMKIHVLCILKNQLFAIFTVVLSRGANTTGKGTEHHFIQKTSAALMNMYCTENMDIPEDFRVELSQFMSLTKRKI